MHKLLFCAAVACAASGGVYSQTLAWTQQIGSALYDNAYAIDTDEEGNVYTTGHFLDTAGFGSGPNAVQLISNGGQDIFIQKNDPQGNLLWVKRLGSPGAEQGIGLATDHAGNVYVTGKFEQTVDFDPGADTANFTAGGFYSAFLLKLDGDGAYQWARTFPATALSLGNKIAVEPGGSIYLAGDFKDMADFDPGPGTAFLTTSDKWTGFVVKLDAGGNYVWANKVGGPGQTTVQGLALDRFGGMLMTGWFEGDAEFSSPVGGVTYFLTPHGYDDIYVCKMDTFGELVWVRQIGSAGFDEGYDLKVDQLGNAVFTGGFGQTTDFDPGPGVYNLVPPASSYYDVFVAKLDAGGNFVWAKRAGGDGADKAYALDIDDSGNIYTTGNFAGQVDFDPGPGTFNLGTSSGAGSFILKTDFLGNFIWAKHSDGNSNNQAISVDQNGAVCTAGFFSPNTVIDPGGASLPLVPAGQQDAVIQKWTQDWNFHGTVFHDANLNGVQDPGEGGVARVILEARNRDRYATTDSLGRYHFYDDIRGDTVSLLTSLPGWTVAPAFAVADSAQTPMNFAADGPPIRDVCIAVVELTPFRPGFQTEVIILVTNVGTVPLDTVPVRLLRVAPAVPMQLELLSAEPSPVSQNDGEINWVTGPIGIYQTVGIRAVFRTPATVTNGTPVDISTTAILEDDAFDQNNTSRIQATVVGSYDPNDKAVTPSLATQQALDTTDLRYVIRFQNTGTYHAEFVVIRDTLPPGLDLSTLKILAASHAYTWKVSGPRVLEIRFDNIDLPDSTANEPGSHGFVAFTARARPGLPAGDSVLNRAGIYFDYNVPVITNYAVLKAAAVSSAGVPAEELDFGMSPNPVAANERVTIDLPEAATVETHVRVYDIAGRTVRSVVAAKGDKQLYLNGLGAGTYFVQLRAGKRSGGKILVVE